MIEMNARTLVHNGIAQLEKECHAKNSEKKKNNAE